MSLDPYALCPCGSGKKLKFCCQDIVAEMEKVERLQENNQPRMALQLLDKLEKSHPGNAWIATNRGLALIHDNRPEEAKNSLAGFLRNSPKHPLANALFGLASMNADGYPECRKAVHRAFLRATGHYPALVGLLAGSLAAAYLDQGQIMAARQHLALAMRIGDEQQRKRAFLSLLELDGDTAIPYPLRGVHRVPQLDEPDSEETRKAGQLAARGCWHEAADLLSQQAAEGTASAEFWHTIGLYRAWSGDESAAIDALRKAADSYENPAAAIECATLAQLFEQMQPENTTKIRVQRYRVESVGRLLTVLDESRRLHRVPDMSPDGQTEEGAPSARYLLLDRPLPGRDEVAGLTHDNIPQHIARLTLFDADPDNDIPAQAYLSGMEGEQLENARDLFAATAGEIVQPEAPESDEPDADVAGQMPHEQVPLQWNAYFPPETPGSVRREFEEKHWNQVWFETWMTTPQQGLDGQSPQDVTGDSARTTDLAASLNVLDAFCDARRIMIPLAQLREKLGLEPPQPLEVDDETSFSNLTFDELRRLKLSELNDEQFRHVLQRALLTRHATFLHAVLLDYLRRDLPEDEAMQQGRAYSTLSEICRVSLQHEEALNWVIEGQKHAATQENAFEQVLQWKMREVTMRIDEPESDEFRTLVLELWNEYGAKLPALRERLTELTQMLGIDPPWSTSIVTPDAGGSKEGPWTPGAAQPPASGEQKLWLPGQD
ncbi:MAG: hypothetical protein ACF8TS_03575 [Maioricimonas sp. JB049]